jgi:hypothetical protein
LRRLLKLLLALWVLRWLAGEIAARLGRAPSVLE